MKILSINISNYRSIRGIKIDVDEKTNFSCFCGANNVGKTNILNALCLFFGTSEYNPEKDCPNHKFYGTRGGHYQPKITIIFFDWTNKIHITKDWNLTSEQRQKSELGYKITWKQGKSTIEQKECLKMIEKINFFYLPSINISFPDAIKYIMDSDIMEMEMSKTRMSGKKKEMKTSIEGVLDGLKWILNSLGENISPLLEKYKEWWGVAFDLPKEVNTFRDLIIGEIEFYIQDKSNSKAIDAKWSWLQRLCHILMFFRITEKLNDQKQTTILCIDEPDVYLHSGLQKKLLEDIKRITERNQIFITTHSAIFIDTVTLKNVFLLDQKIEEKEYQRAKRVSEDKKYNAVETLIVDLNEENWITILKKYLGIDDGDNLLFDKYNILVEGEEDKIYFSKLMQHFWINVPRIIACGWADNVRKYLEFYESIIDTDKKINFLVVLDNDQKWRDVYRNIKAENFTNIEVEKKLTIAYSGFNPDIDQNGNSSSNIEVEDFIKPKIICYLGNKILKQKKFAEFSKNDIDTLCKNINKPAFRNSGILSSMENKKNELNPENGQNIQMDGQAFKTGISKLFNQLDKNLIKLIGTKYDTDNQNILNFLESISKKIN